MGLKVGNYVITGAIGAGGMGAVYVAEHPEIGRRVAVKLLPPHLGHWPGLAERFRAEARAVARIEHPNVIEIYDYGQTDDEQLYYTMELLKGHELADDISQRAPMTPEEILPHVQQVCAALQAAHDSGVVHRDLKPENIFVLDRPELTLKLLDFGLAKMTEPEQGTSQTATGQVMGTPLTIAPEQAAGRPGDIGPHTDLYSLGVIIFWMLAGRPPFEEESAALLLAKHITEPAPPLAGCSSGVPQGICALVDHCLRKEPGERPASAEAIASRFTASLKSGKSVGIVPFMSPAAEAEAPTEPAAILPQTTAGLTPSLKGEVASAIPSRRPHSRHLLLVGAVIMVALGLGGFLLSRSTTLEPPEAGEDADPGAAAAPLLQAEPSPTAPALDMGRLDVARADAAPEPRRKALRKRKPGRRARQRTGPKTTTPAPQPSRPKPAPAPIPAAPKPTKPEPAAPAKSKTLGEDTVPF